MTPDLAPSRGILIGCVISLAFWLGVAACHAQELQPVQQGASSSVLAIPSGEEGQVASRSASSGEELTRQFSLSLGSYVGLSVLDAAYSVHLFASHPHTYEGGLGRGLEQQPAKYLAVKSAAIAGTVAVLSVLQTHHPRMAKWATWSLVGLEAGVIAHNVTVTR